MDTPFTRILTHPSPGSACGHLPRPASLFARLVQEPFAHRGRPVAGATHCTQRGARSRDWPELWPRASTARIDRQETLPHHLAAPGEQKGQSRSGPDPTRPRPDQNSMSNARHLPLDFRPLAHRMNSGVHPALRGVRIASCVFAAHARRTAGRMCTRTGGDLDSTGSP